MTQKVWLKKGLNINLRGRADKVYANTPSSRVYCIKPINFYSLKPKLTVQVGDQVNAGTSLFCDKRIFFTIMNSHEDLFLDSIKNASIQKNILKRRKHLTTHVPLGW